MSKEVTDAIKLKIKEDLSIKIGTKEEAFWTEMREKFKAELEGDEKMVKFHKAILDMCEAKIKESR